MGELLTAFGSHGLVGLVCLALFAAGYFMMKEHKIERKEHRAERMEAEKRHKSERDEFKDERNDALARNEETFKTLAKSLDGLSSAVNLSNEINRNR